MQGSFESLGSVIFNFHFKAAQFQIIFLQICDSHFIFNDQYSAHLLLPPDICVLQSTW